MIMMYTLGLAVVLSTFVVAEEPEVTRYEYTQGILLE